MIDILITYVSCNVIYCILHIYIYLIFDFTFRDWTNTNIYYYFDIFTIKKCNKLK